jgi:hypothetical protein
MDTQSILGDGCYGKQSILGGGGLLSHLHYIYGCYAEWL